MEDRREDRREVVPTEVGAAMSLEQVKGQLDLLRAVMSRVMQRDVHYGVIPGCGNRPVLLKPGAEVLAALFGLAPRFRHKIERDDGAFRVLSKCTLYRRDGSVAAEATAICTSTEARMGRSQDPFIENRTLKMADKRAYVSAVLYATGGSELWTCDLEDIDDRDIDVKTPPTATQHAAPAAPAQQQAPMQPAYRPDASQSYKMPDGVRVSFARCATPAQCAKCGGKTLKISDRGYCYLCERDAHRYLQNMPL